MQVNTYYLLDIKRPDILIKYSSSFAFIHASLTSEGPGSGHRWNGPESLIHKFVTDDAKLEGLLQRLRKMSDPELLRFGMVSKHLCSLEGNSNSHSQESLVIQLHEARKEWKQRYPTLPLNESF
jgi:hypothetical protein